VRQVLKDLVAAGAIKVRTSAAGTTITLLAEWQGISDSAPTQILAVGASVVTVEDA
jgi:hypothetical protein